MSHSLNFVTLKLIALCFICGRDSPLLMGLVVSLLMPRLVDRCPLGYTLVMTSPDDMGALWKTEDPFHRFPVVHQQADRRKSVVSIPDLDVAATVVLGPYAEDIFSASDADDDAAHLLTSFHELVTDDSHQ